MDNSEFDEAYEDDPESAEREARRLGAAILSAQIRELEPHPAVSVPETASIREAIQVMLDRDIGAVLVQREGRLVGIFTERDVLRRVVLSGVDHARPVAQVMTPAPETLGLDDDIAFALNRMVTRGFRHIPLLDASGRPAGMLSVRDVVSFIDKLLPAHVRNLPPEPGLEARSEDGG